MQKRGQITTFIILGIVVLAIVALFIYLTGETAKAKLPSQPSVSSDVVPVQKFVDECLVKTGQEGIIANSLQGGYYQNFDQQALPLPKMIFVPVYFDGFRISVPTEDKIKTELEKYTQDNLKKCIQNFSSLQGFTITELGNVTIKQMVLGDNKVSISYDYPIKINEKIEMRDFAVDYNIRLGKVLGVVKTLIGQSQLVPGLICISCLVDAGVENNLTFDTLQWGEYTVITVNDVSTKTPLSFNYAVKLVNATI